VIKIIKTSVEISLNTQSPQILYDDDHSYGTYGSVAKTQQVTTPTAPASAGTLWRQRSAQKEKSKREDQLPIATSSLLWCLMSYVHGTCHIAGELMNEISSDGIHPREPNPS
jgi:hypothetical protein